MSANLFVRLFLSSFKQTKIQWLTIHTLIYNIDANKALALNPDQESYQFTQIWTWNVDKQSHLAC